MNLSALSSMLPVFVNFFYQLHPIFNDSVNLAFEFKFGCSTKFATPVAKKFLFHFKISVISHFRDGFNPINFFLKLSALMIKLDVLTLPFCFI
jgi:hypothetical protein